MKKCCVCKGKNPTHQIYYTKYYRCSGETTKEYTEPLHYNCYKIVSSKDYTGEIPLAMCIMRGGCENYGIEKIQY